MRSISSIFEKLKGSLPQTAWPRRAAAIAALWVGGAVLLLSTPLLSQVLAAQLQIFPAITQSQLREAMNGPPCAIVILSAGRRAYAPEFDDETIDALSLERVRYGALLARQTRRPILVSGFGVGPKEPPLARLMAEALLTDYGIRARWLESRSSNTAENAIYSAQILRRDGFTRVILVTHAWHMARARAAFEANGISVIPAPTAFYAPTINSAFGELVPNVDALRMSAYAIHEIIGRAWYSIRYGYR